MVYIITLQELQDTRDELDERRTTGKRNMDAVTHIAYPPLITKGHPSFLPHVTIIIQFSTSNK